MKLLILLGQNKRKHQFSIIYHKMNISRQGTGPVFRKCSPKLPVGSIPQPIRVNPLEQLKKIIPRKDLDGVLDQSAAIQRNVELLRVSWENL